MGSALGRGGGAPRRVGGSQLRGQWREPGHRHAAAGAGAGGRGALDLDRRGGALRGADEIVDWYHASEHLWTVARAVYGEGTTAATAWAEASLTVLYEQGAARFLERLHDLTPATEAARATVATERGYFQTNRARMAYPAFRPPAIRSARARWNRARSMSSSSG